MTDFATRLDSYVPEQLSAMNLPGAAIALIEPDRPVSYYCYGLADVASGRAIDTDTLFQIASISKSVAAWGVMLLVDRGLLDLDRPINDYLTRWKIPSDTYDANSVTPRLLLMHFGGTSMSGCGGVPYGHSEYSIESILTGNIPGLDAKQTEYALRWGLDPSVYGKPVTLINEPGTTYEYSGGGLTILELLVEELSGRDFNSFMCDEVLTPLGMTESNFDLREEQRPRVAVPYTEDLEPITLYRVNGRAAGGMYSSIRELAAFACAEMPGSAGEPPGRSVLREATVAEMHRPDRYAETELGLDFYSGLGHYVMDIAGTRAVQHTGGNPGWRSVYTVVPEQGRGFVCLINSAGGNELWMDLSMQWARSFLDF